MITAEQWYEHDPELQNYYQGDILSEIPFATLPTFLVAAKQEAWGILRPRNRNRDPRPVNEILRNLPSELIGRAAKDVVDAWSDPVGEYLISLCRKMTVMLVSRSCDVDKHSRKHFLVAPVVPIAGLPEGQRTDEKLRDLRANEIFHWFYLPAFGKLPESFADLSIMGTVHRTFFDVELLKANLVGRLSGLGTTGFQTALSNFYGNKFGFSPPDKVAQDGSYSCSGCFHSGFPAPHRKDLKVGAYFGECPNCGEEALWVKMP